MWQPTHSADRGVRVNSGPLPFAIRGWVLNEKYKGIIFYKLYKTRNCKRNIIGLISIEKVKHCNLYSSC